LRVTPKVSVVVPHLDDLDRLDACLEALARQTFPLADCEVIVADNDSPQGRAAVAEVVGDRARLIVVAERGAGPARNGGAAAATGEILAFTDCDCLPEPGWLAGGVAALERFDIVGGRTRVLVRDPERLTPAEAFERVFAFDNESYVSKKRFTVTANLFCRRELFETVGGFNNGISEDVEWSHRAVLAGYQIGYEANAVVGHPARRTWRELQTKWRRLNLESYALRKGRRWRTFRWLLRSLALPMSAIAHSPAVFASPSLTSMDQRMSALRMLYRLRFWRMLDALRLARNRVSEAVLAREVQPARPDKAEAAGLPAPPPPCGQIEPPAIPAVLLRGRSSLP
jgi:glycosyltransferase involved in cell wall biosynthesis